MMRELVFTYYPSPVLRMKAEYIDMSGRVVPPDDVLALLKQMKHICVEKDGVGLAAQQVGIVAPVIVFGVPEERGEESESKRYKLVGVVNPDVVEQDDEKVIREEGCLSFPGLYIPIWRSRRIVVEGWFDDVRSFERRKLSDMSARIFSHETDHINGILFIDRATEDIRQRIKPDLMRIARRYRK